MYIKCVKDFLWCDYRPRDPKIFWVWRGRVYKTSPGWDRRYMTHMTSIVWGNWVFVPASNVEVLAQFGSIEDI